MDKLFENIASAMGSGVRQVFIGIDSAVYGLFNKVFELFFDISRAQFLAGDIYTVIFKRVFLIIGIFMLFKLVLSFLTYLISPDSMNDSHNPGNVGKLIGRVIASLLFLVVLVPIGTDTEYAKGSGMTDANTSGFNYNIQNQGILFGTLQSVQDAVLSEDNNVIGKLILGNNVNSVNMSTTGNNIATTVFAAFFRINEDAIDKTNYGDDYDGICRYNGTDTKISLNYKVTDFNSAKNLTNIVCENSGEELFVYDIFVSTIVGIIIDVLISLFTFDVALRTIKLGILRLIAPIPAISYISPKSSKDGAFANYTKTLMSTYVDIFLRVALIYLVILLISHISSPSSQIVEYNNSNGFAKVIIIITLLLFAVQAPKFIMQALGIKSKGTGLGFGAALLGGALAGGVSGLATGGVSGAIKGFLGGANAGTQNQWAAQNGQKPNMSARQAALNRGAQLGSGDPNAKGMGVGSIITGGIGNLLTGTNMQNLDKQKKQFFNDQRDLGDRERIASNLGYGHNLTAQDMQFLENQKYENGNDIVRKNSAGAYEFLDSNGTVLSNTDDMAAALAFDNSEKKKNLGRRQDDLEKAKKQNAYHDPRAMKPKFTAFKRYKGK